MCQYSRLERLFSPLRGWYEYFTDGNMVGWLMFVKIVYNQTRTESDKTEN